MENLAKQSILSYTKYNEPLTEEQIAGFLTRLPQWRMIYQEGNPRIERSFEFEDFLGAINWGKCTVRWWTFVYKKLHENDFIMAARTELLYKGLS